MKKEIKEVKEEENEVKKKRRRKKRVKENGRGGKEASWKRKGRSREQEGEADKKSLG